MSAAKKQTKANDMGATQHVMVRELSEVCGDAARDVLELALLFAAHPHVPSDDQALRSFIFGELKQTLARVEGQETAERVCDTLAGLLLDQTGTHRLVPESRHTTRPRHSHTKAIAIESFPNSLDELLATANLEFAPRAHAPRHPVLVLSELPQAAEEIQQALGERVEVYHHASLDFFESDLLILAERHPVAVIDCRERHAAFCARFLGRADRDLAVLVWGSSVNVELPGRRMVSCVAGSSPAELAMLVDVFLPEYRSGRDS